MFTAREGCYHCRLLHHCCLSLLSLCFFILAFSYCKFNLKAHRDGASLYIYICTYLMQEGSSVSESLPLYEAIIKELLLLLQWPESRGQCGAAMGWRAMTPYHSLFSPPQLLGCHGQRLLRQLETCLLSVQFISLLTLIFLYFCCLHHKISVCFFFFSFFLVKVQEELLMGSSHLIFFLSSSLDFFMLSTSLY